MGERRIPAALIETPARARRLYRPAADLGVSEVGMQILVFLTRERAATAAEIQRHLELEQTRTSHAIRRLVDADLVETGEDPDDKRRKPLHTTAAGDGLVTKFLHRVRGMLGDEGRAGKQG